MSAAGEEFFCLCQSCWGRGSMPSSLGPITCGTCKGKGTLTIARIPRLPVLPREDRCDCRRRAA